MIIKKNNQTKNPGKEAVNTGEKKPLPPVKAEKKQEAFDFSRAIIKERQERRRGDRRRGYRRNDDRSLISRAQEEANAIKESAAMEGFEYGVNLSAEEIKKLNAAINEFITAKERVMQNAIPDIALLAVKAAEKLIKKELKIDETIILKVVTDVIKSISKDETEIRIKTNPNDAELVRENLPELFPYNQSTKIMVIPDESVDWGSCIVETKNGIVDAKFSTQLQVLQKALEAGL
ncbi:MAG TPA: FliH/SctL family protein [Candidatus Gastranaerophilales bacterium]|nr:FliH/SctL family protein [Candidatus Gastranaerophilales bacterium]